MVKETLRSITEKDRFMANEKDFSIELKQDVAKGSYSNLAIITHSRSEFILDFASMLPGLPKPEVHNRIIMNPEHAKSVPSQLGKSIEEALGLMKTSLETVNNNCRSFVIDVPTQMNDDTIIHDCFDLFNVKLSIENSAHPEAAFNAIEKAGIDGEIVDKDNRIYPANSIHQILKMLKEASVDNYQYRFIAKKS